MDPSKELMLKSNRHQLVLTVLFIVFILFLKAVYVHVFLELAQVEN